MPARSLQDRSCQKPQSIAFCPKNGRNPNILPQCADQRVCVVKQNGGDSFSLAPKKNHDSVSTGPNQSNDISTADDTNIRILIVDDDQDICLSLSDIFELDPKQYFVKTAHNLKDAEHIARKFHPDIVLIDIKLGKDSGLNLVPWLKNEFTDIVCIIMTAYREPMYTVAALRAGADDFLYKPIDTNHLIKTVDRAAEQKKLQQLRDSTERRFKAVFEQTFQGLILTNDKGAIVDANEAALNFLPIDNSILTNTPLWEAPWWNRSNNLQQSIKKCTLQALDGKFQREEIVLIDKYGNEATFDISFKPVNNKQGMVELVVVECRDITERKQAECLLLEARDNLEARVKKRTAELEKAITIAEKESRAKSEFLSRMSHELRTPMNAILGFTQLLLMQDEPHITSVQKESLEEIMYAGNHLLELISEILDLQRIQSGKLEIPMDIVNVYDLVDNSLRLIDPLAKQRNISISVENCDKDIFVHANFTRLKQVLLNFLSNAVKYNFEKGKITISVERRTENRIRINVSDTGPGLSNEQIEKLFIPFERLGDIKNIDGIGIGLVISQQLCNLMHGTLGVHSEINKGCTFWVEFNQ